MRRAWGSIVLLAAGSAAAQDAGDAAALKADVQRLVDAKSVCMCTSGEWQHVAGRLLSQEQAIGGETRLKLRCAVSAWRADGTPGRGANCSDFVVVGR